MAEPVPTLRLGNLTYHLPFATLIRPLTVRERADLESSIRAHKKILVRVVTYDSPIWGERCVIDGGNRLAIAIGLGFDVPVQHRGSLTDEAARLECIALNVDRRQLTTEEQEEARSNRIGRVVAAKGDGRSLREIAREEGVSQTQIARDLADSAGFSVTPVTDTYQTESDESKALHRLAKSLRALVRMERPTRGADLRPVGALPDVLSGPHRARLERIAARHGVPLDGDRWPLMDTLSAILSDLVAEAVTE